MIDQAEQGRREAEALRPQRIVNYRVKRAAEWRCQHDGCGASQGVLVVHPQGQDDDRLTTRCRNHMEGWISTPGQWIDR